MTSGPPRLFQIRANAEKALTLTELFLYSCDSREDLAFDSLEEGTTTGGDVRNFVGKTELGAACY